MWQYTLKIALSAILLVAIAELAKRSSFLGAALASIPLMSLLAFVWLRATLKKWLPFRKEFFGWFYRHSHCLLCCHFYCALA